MVERSQRENQEKIVAYGRTRAGNAESVQKLQAIYDC